MDTKTRSGRCRTALVGAALLGVLLAGCGGEASSSGHDPSAAPGDATSSASSSPTVEPATGGRGRHQLLQRPRAEGLARSTRWSRTSSRSPASAMATAPSRSGSRRRTATPSRWHGRRATPSRRTPGSGKDLDVDLHSSLAGEPAYRLSGKRSGEVATLSPTGSLRGPPRHGVLELRPLSRRQRSPSRGLGARQLAVEVTGGMTARACPGTGGTC